MLARSTKSRRQYRWIARLTLWRNNWIRRECNILRINWTQIAQLSILNNWIPVHLWISTVRCKLTWELCKPMLLMILNKIKFAMSKINKCKITEKILIMDKESNNKETIIVARSMMTIKWCSKSISNQMKVLEIEVQIVQGRALLSRKTINELIRHMSLRQSTKLVMDISSNRKRTIAIFQNNKDNDGQLSRKLTKMRRRAMSREVHRSPKSSSMTHRIMVTWMI